MITSPVACAKPVLYARPYPRTSSRTTFAPKLFATSDVRSVDPLSTTIVSSTKSGMRFSTRSMPCSSFNRRISHLNTKSIGNHNLARMSIFSLYLNGFDIYFNWSHNITLFVFVINSATMTIF